MPAWGRERNGRMAKKKAGPRNKRTPAASTTGQRRGSATAILKSYRAGATLDELKKKYGLRGKSQLATALFEALIKGGTLPPLRSAAPKASLKPRSVTVRVNKRGTIILPKDAVIDTFGSKVGQAYTIRKRGAKIILTAKG